MVLDMLCIIGTEIAVGYFTFGRFLSPATLDQVELLIPVYWTIAANTGTYSSRALTSLRFSQSRAVASVFISLMVMIFLAFFLRTGMATSRVWTLGSTLANAVTLSWLRSFVQPHFRNRCGPTAENVLIFNDGGPPLRIAHAWHIDTTEHGLRPDRFDPHMLDRLGLFMTNMDRVLVSCPPERRSDWALVFKGSNISGEIVEPDVATLGAIGARRGLDFGALVVSAGPLNLRDRALKRLMDIAIAGTALAALAPLLILIALAIRIQDGGPVFFMQQRQGRNNRLFWIYKFRSMRVEKLDATGSRSASKDDERITPVGRFIRRTSIDEMPQLINVLRGDMSIVGPRPHAIGSLAGTKRFWEVDSRYLLRHSLKPGLTGLAQIRGYRGATDTEHDLAIRLQADLEYVDGWTIWRDLHIMVATLRVLVHDRAF
ncbi:sugar transferase [Novosphingobium nitrogenifigens DSM 19370]|uniref:Sugar transferase n=1 Tax=Novosphingobium nitrogenifigens DSM 19370 TaxID=983920 RepID=F1ZDU0_9SPHN|nr:exopolysaccharide biosynthesis polyprenyl glycosylphosphotransferase [Novosphingobium nitrogenifigens]EGD57223.1 sugar transferase [Novosphingobium nitrogenifigens DSM 19370]